MLTTAVVVGVGSLVAGAAGLYASGSTGPSTGITKTVEDSVSAVTQQVSDATQQVQPEDNPEPVTPPVNPIPVEPEQPVEQPVEPVEQPVEQPVAVEQPVEPVEQPVEPVEPPKPVAEPVQNLTDAERERLNILLDRDSMHPMQGQSLTAAEEKELADLRSRQNPSFPKTDSMAGGQRGGYGRPTWAPLNSGTTLIQALGVQPSTPAGKLIASATGTKTPDSIQLKLKEIDDELRMLRSQEYITNLEVGELERAADTVRKTFSKSDSAVGLYNKLKNLYQSKIDKVRIEETNIKGSEYIFELINARFPLDQVSAYLTDANKQRIVGNLPNRKKKRGAAPPGPPAGLSNEDKLWFIKTFRIFRSFTGEEREEIDEENFFKVGALDMGLEITDNFKAVDDSNKPGLDLAANQPRDQATMTAIYPTLNKTEETIANEWWFAVRNISKVEEINIEQKSGELTDLFAKRSEQEALVLTNEREKKIAEKELVEKDKEVVEKRIRLEEIKKKIRDIQETKKLALLDLSKFELPKTSMSFFNKQPALVQRSTLPTGAERDEIFAKIKYLEQKIKDKEEEISDYVSANFNEVSNTIPEEAKKKINEMRNDENVPGNLKDLIKQRDTEISRLEGRVGETVELMKKEIVESRKWKDMIVQLRLAADKEQKFLEPRLAALYASFETMISEKNETSIEENINSYYTTFTTQKDNWFLTSGLTTLIKSIVSLDDVLNKSACPWTKGDKIKLYSANAPAEITGTGSAITPGNGNRLYIEGEIIRPILTSSPDKSVEVCGQLRVKITKSNEYADTAERTLGADVDNINKEAKISVSAGVEFLSGNLYDTWKHSVADKIVAFNKLLEKIKEDYPEPSTGIRGLNPFQSENVNKRKVIQRLQEQLVNVALPFFKGGPLISHPLRKLFNSPIDSIRKVLAYLMGLKLKETLKNVAMTLLSPVPALYNFIMRADWSDMKDIDRTIDLMTKLVEDTTDKVDGFAKIPETDKEKIKGLLATLKKTKSLANKAELLKGVDEIYVKVVTAGAEETVWIPNDTPVEEEKETSIRDGRPTDPGDGSRRQVTLYKKFILPDFNSYQSMFDSLADVLGINYTLANALLPIVKYKLVDEATYNATDAANQLAVFKSPISGTTTFFDIHLISEAIAEDKLEERSNARRSNIGLVLHLIIKHSVTTLPAALISIIPAGIWVGISSILESRSVKHDAELNEAEMGLPNLMSELYFDLNNLPLNTQIKTKVPVVDIRDRKEYTTPTDQYNASEYTFTMEEIKKLIGTVDTGQIKHGSIDVDSADSEQILIQYKRLKQYQKTLRALSDKKDAASWYTIIISGLKVVGIAVVSPVAAAGAIIASPVYALYLMFTYTPDYFKKQLNAYSELAMTFFKMEMNLSTWSQRMGEEEEKLFNRTESTIQNSAKSLFFVGEDALTPSEKELVKKENIGSLEEFNAKFNQFTSSILGKIYSDATEGTSSQLATVNTYIDKFEEIFSTTGALQIMNTIRESVMKLYGTEVEYTFFPVINAFLKLFSLSTFTVKTSGFARAGLGILYLLSIPVELALTPVIAGVGLAVVIPFAIPIKIFMVAIPILMKFFADSLTLVQTTLLIGKLVGGTIVYGGIVWPISKLLLLLFTIAKVLRTIAIRPLLAILNRLWMGIRLLTGAKKEEITDWYASLKTMQLFNKEGKFEVKGPSRVTYGELLNRNRGLTQPGAAIPPPGPPGPPPIDDLKTKFLRTVDELLAIPKADYDARPEINKEEYRLQFQQAYEVARKGDQASNFVADPVLAQRISDRYKEVVGNPIIAPPQGGNHETRRHRVRGMPKRAKTRRMY